MVLLEQIFSLEDAVGNLVARALGFPFADLAQVLEEKGTHTIRAGSVNVDETDAPRTTHLVGLVVKHARGREVLVPVLQGRVEQLPLLLELDRLELDEIRRVVAAGDQFAGHVVDVLNTGGSALMNYARKLIVA